MKILLNEQEQHALDGLPLLAFCLYVKALKPRLDIATGTIGIKPRISWQALGEWLYVEPHSGIKSGSPSKTQLRRAALWLQRAGLIKQIVSNNKQLVFKCLLTTQDYSQQKQVNRKLTVKINENDIEQATDSVENFNTKPNTSWQSQSSKADIHNLTSTKLNLTTGDENSYCFKDKTIPETNQHWLTFFINVSRFDIDSVQTIKTLSLFDHWCCNNISIGLVKQAMVIAHNTLGRIPDSPLYYRNFVDEWMNHQCKLKQKTNFKVMTNQGVKIYGRRKAKSAAETMWQSCEEGLKGTDFEHDIS